jgi:hypothetical protein
MGFCRNETFSTHRIPPEGETDALTFAGRAQKKDQALGAGALLQHVL